MRCTDSTTARGWTAAVGVQAARRVLGDERLRPAVVLGTPHARALVLRCDAVSCLELDPAPHVIHERFKSEATLVPTFQGRYDVVRGTKHERDLRAFLERVEGVRADRNDALVFVHDPDLRGHDARALEAEPGEHVLLEDTPWERHDEVLARRQHRWLVVGRLVLSPKRARVLADLHSRFVQLTLEVMLTTLHAMLARLRRRARVLRTLQRIAEIRDIVHRPLELADDHGHALIRLGLELVGHRRERRRRGVPIEPSRDPRESRAGGEANDDPREETASGAVDEWNEDNTKRDWCDPRQVLHRSHVRPSRVARRGLRMRVTEGAIVAEPMLHWSVQLSSSRSCCADSGPATERASRQRGTRAKTPRTGEYSGCRTLPLSADGGRPSSSLVTGASTP